MSCPRAPFHTLTLHEIRNLMPPLDRWAVNGCVVDNDGLSLATGIICGTPTAVSDRSYKDKIGTSGFVLRGSFSQPAILGNNIVPSNPEKQSSYRSELAGISGVLAILSAVCKKYDIHKGSILLALDGKQALLKASSTWPLSPTDMDFDLLCDI
jgi:hypothetical protein